MIRNIIFTERHCQQDNLYHAFVNAYIIMNKGFVNKNVCLKIEKKKSQKGQLKNNNQLKFVKYIMTNTVRRIISTPEVKIFYL